MSPDTIAAISTAPGEAGIGIVRASGPAAVPCALALFRRSTPLPDPESHRAYYGHVVRAGTGDRLDDCVLTCYRAPHSYTGEDVAELACHGSNLVLAQVLRGLLDAGARLAEPGEFTRRAFLNGRLDLAEAEAVIDVIRARTDSALRVATGQLGGRLSTEIAALRSRLIALLAEIEAGIDFPDEIDPPADADVAARARAVSERAAELLQTADAGRLYREGAAVVLVGRPNVGKSSLLNALLGEARALVTDVPGTTRDVIEEGLNLRGIPIRAVDTAGLRDTEDPVEALGVERTRQQVASADVVLWVLDASAGLTEADRALLPGLHGRNVVVAANKSDLGGLLSAEALREAWGEALPWVEVSAVTGAGVVRLESTLAEVLLGGQIAPESVWVSSVRHQSHLVRAREALQRAIEAADAGFDQAAVALDLKLAASALGEITGDTIVEDTITQIFARFCVGK